MFNFSQNKLTYILNKLKKVLKKLFERNDLVREIFFF